MKKFIAVLLLALAQSCFAGHLTGNITGNARGIATEGDMARLNSIGSAPAHAPATSSFAVCDDLRCSRQLHSIESRITVPSFSNTICGAGECDIPSVTQPKFKRTEHLDIDIRPEDQVFGVRFDGKRVFRIMGDGSYEIPSDGGCATIQVNANKITITPCNKGEEK